MGITVGQPVPRLSDSPQSNTSTSEKENEVTNSNFRDVKNGGFIKAPSKHHNNVHEVLPLDAKQTRAFQYGPKSSHVFCVDNRRLNRVGLDDVSLSPSLVSLHGNSNAKICTSNVCTDLNSTKISTHFNSSNSGAYVNSSNTGTDVNPSNTGTDVNYSHAGTNMNSSNTGANVNSSYTGTNMNSSNTGANLNFSNTGINVNSSHARANVNYSNTGANVNSSYTGTNKNSFSTGTNVNSSDSCSYLSCSINLNSNSSPNWKSSNSNANMTCSETTMNLNCASSGVRSSISSPVSCCNTVQGSDDINPTLVRNKCLTPSPIQKGAKSLSPGYKGICSPVNVCESIDRRDIEVHSTIIILGDEEEDDEEEDYNDGYNSSSSSDVEFLTVPESTTGTSGRGTHEELDTDDEDVDVILTKSKTLSVNVQEYKEFNSSKNENVGRLSAENMSYLSRDESEDSDKISEGSEDSDDDNSDDKMPPLLLMRDSFSGDGSDLPDSEEGMPPLVLMDDISRAKGGILVPPCVSAKEVALGLSSLAPGRSAIQQSNAVKTDPSRTKLVETIANTNVKSSISSTEKTISDISPSLKFSPAVSKPCIKSHKELKYITHNSSSKHGLAIDDIKQSSLSECLQVHSCLEPEVTTHVIKVSPKSYDSRNVRNDLSKSYAKSYPEPSLSKVNKCIPVADDESHSPNYYSGKAQKIIQKSNFEKPNNSVETFKLPKDHDVPVAASAACSLGELSLPTVNSPSSLVPQSSVLSSGVTSPRCGLLTANTTTIILSSDSEYQDPSKSHSKFYEKPSKHSDHTRKEAKLSLSSSSSRASSRSSNHSTSSDSSLPKSRPSSSRSPPVCKLPEDKSITNLKQSSSSCLRPMSGSSGNLSQNSRPSSESPPKKFFKDTVPNLYSSSDEEGTLQENKTEIVKKIYSTTRTKPDKYTGKVEVSRRSVLFKTHKQSAVNDTNRPVPAPSTGPLSKPPATKDINTLPGCQSEKLPTAKHGDSSPSSPSSSDLSDIDDVQDKKLSKSLSNIKPERKTENKSTELPRVSTKPRLPINRQTVPSSYPSNTEGMENKKEPKSLSNLKSEKKTENKPPELPRVSIKPRPPINKQPLPSSSSLSLTSLPWLTEVTIPNSSQKNPTPKQTACRKLGSNSRTGSLMSTKNGNASNASSDRQTNRKDTSLTQSSSSVAAVRTLPSNKTKTSSGLSSFQGQKQISERATALKPTQSAPDSVRDNVDKSSKSKTNHVSVKHKDLIPTSTKTNTVKRTNGLKRTYSKEGAGDSRNGSQSPDSDEPASKRRDLRQSSKTSSLRKPKARQKSLSPQRDKADLYSDNVGSTKGRSRNAKTDFVTPSERKSKQPLSSKKGKPSRAKKKRKKIVTDTSSDDDDSEGKDDDDEDDIDVHDMLDSDEDDESDESESWDLPDGVQYYDNLCSAKKCLNPEGKQVDWVMCDKCQQWYHVVCVKCPSNVLKEDLPFHCGLC